jgi:hypothetical protein
MGLTYTLIAIITLLLYYDSSGYSKVKCNKAANKQNRKNSDELKKNMKEAGKKPNQGDQAHHIVHSGHQRAEETRDILKRFDININDSSNGVFLTKKQHGSLNKHDYIYQVLAKLRDATTPGEARRILDRIGQKLLNDTFKY